MTGLDRNLPEPSLPEHALIREAAPTPRLSAGFRERLLSECGANVRVAQHQLRLKVAALLAVGCCCLGLLIWHGITGTSEPYVQRPSPPIQELQAPSPSAGHRYSDDSSPESLQRQQDSPGMALDKALPNPKSELEQMERLMEGLRNRSQQVFNANMLPGF